MTEYICKCGRKVLKSTNANNTGNRDTAGCTGCPYLLPWGPYKYIEGQGYTTDVQGYECRMSPTINYTTTYHGKASDKCTLRILSLDLDFLDNVQAWIYDTAADTLSAGFSRGSMRGTDFSDKGRYSLSISCVQNKKGMAAKAALLEHFFGPDKHRLDMFPEKEKSRILAAIEAGKAQAQEKEKQMKKQNNRCPLQQECERTCKVIGHERDCDYYVNNRYCTDGIPDQDELLAEEEIRKERELEERYIASLSAEPVEPVVYRNEYGTLFAVREHKGTLDLMCKAKEADSWSLSGVLAAVKGEAYTAEDLQEVLDEYARAHGWKEAVLEAPENPTQAAPASPADAGAATQSLSAAEPASLAAESAPEAFDYSGLDDQTVSVLHMAEQEIRSARQAYICRVSSAVAAAHEAVVANCENGEKGQFASHENTFLAWCASVGLKKDAAYRLLQVNALLTGATAEEQATLEAAGPSLLYAAAKPSAPAELVQAVKDGDITTHKQYQEALAEIRTRDAKIKELLEMSEESDRRADEARAWAKAAEKARDEACKELDGARQAFQAAKLRGDKLKEQLEASKDQVIEARVVDREDVERLARERAAELTAPLRDELEELRTFRQNQDAEQVQRDAYDAFILAARIMDNTWQALRPQAARLAEDQRSGAKNLLLQKLMEIKEDVIHVC